MLRVALLTLAVFAVGDLPDYRFSPQEEFRDKLRVKRRNLSGPRRRGFWKKIKKAVHKWTCTKNDWFNHCNEPPTKNPDWMSKLADSRKVTSMSMPGTHDSGAIHGGWAPTYVRCQSLGIYDQLVSGIRFMDIRLRHYGDGLLVHHGQVYMKMNFEEVLSYVKKFLNAYPKETIFMRISKEYKDENPKGNFADLVEKKLLAELGSSMLGPKNQNIETVTLGSLRGKLNVLQNFNGPKFPIDGAIYWYKDSDIQDYFDVKYTWNVKTKKKKIKEQLDKARKDDGELYINYLSGTGSVMGGIGMVARKTNKYALNNLGSTGKGLGIIVMDFPGGKLISEIIKRN